MSSFEPGHFLKLNPLPDQVFAHDAQVNCIGVHIRAGGMVVGKITDYEIVDGGLILTIEMDSPIRVVNPSEIDAFVYHA